MILLYHFLTFQLALYVSLVADQSQTGFQCLLLLDSSKLKPYLKRKRGRGEGKQSARVRSHSVSCSAIVLYVEEISYRDHLDNQQ